MELSLEEIGKQLDDLLTQARQALGNVQELASLESLRVQWLGRKGTLAHFFGVLKDPALPLEGKAELGKRLNTVKNTLEALFAERQKTLGKSSKAASGEDLTLPGHPVRAGRLHPITQTIEQIVGIFRSLGFFVVEGPEMETEFHNFDALNIPPEHPSRENFDTFYLSDPKKESDSKQKVLLRSHTSPVQIRFMEAHEPPFRIVVPGRVFRPDAIDPSHSFQFHQVEGLAVEPKITFGDLKGVLLAWARGMFGPKATLRFRPHFFPFTEPSAEADLACIFCAGRGCRVCGQKGWLEILGCGLVHPHVFRSVGYPNGTVGFAFGMGVERIAMLKYGIQDIRLFSENDLRFLQQVP